MFNNSMKKLVIILLFCILLTSSVSAYKIYYYHNDHLGNPVAITNEDGEVVWKADYEPFGEIFNEEEIEIGNKFGYNTKELNKNTNLLYYGARYYDPGIGRFTTADTVKGSLGAPQSLNRYTYTLNNPLKYIDPSGNEENDFMKIQQQVVDDIFQHKDAIIGLANDWGVTPKTVASIVYVERMQYQLNSYRRIKETLLKSNIFSYVYSMTDRSTGWAHITSSAAKNSASLAEGKSVVVKSTSSALYPDTERTLCIGDKLKTVYDSTEKRLDRFPIDDYGVNLNIDTNARLLAVLTEMYKQAGHDISYRPDILATTYNIGIRNSFPMPGRDPQSGGSFLPYILDGEYIEGVSFGERVDNVYTSKVIGDMFK